MVLSIGMIVKNEEKYLERCLAALQPILNELDSELIIADTGSTDRTVEIAKKFTDNVFYFEWINDFAAARNSTLEKAQGEWFMFIDADEIAVDCTDIIHFFKSRECDKFQSAVYIQRSLVDPDNLNEYGDFRPLRMVKREANTKFLGAIHEYLSPAYTPVKHLDFVVLHYGYIYEDVNGATELAYKKSKRNLDILLAELDNEELAKEQHEGIYGQIADCYEIIGDMDNTFKYLDMGLTKLPHDILKIASYYSHKIKLLNDLERFEEVAALADEYFDISKNPFHTKELATDCFIRAMQGYACYKLKNYGKAIDALSEFITLYGKYKRGKLNTLDLLGDVWRLTGATLQASYDVFFRCCYQEKRFALANDYVNAIPLEMYYDNHSFMINHLNIRIEIMENVGYNKLDALYRRLDEFGRNYLLTWIRRKVFKTTPQNRTMIIKKLSSLDGLPVELAKIYSNYFEKGNADFDAMSAFLTEHGSENGEDMLYILLEKQMDIAPFLLAKDFFADRAVQILMKYFPNGIELYENYDINKISPEALVQAISLYGWVLRRAVENNRKVTGFFKMYSDLGARWDRSFPNNFTVPGDVRAARLAGEVVAAKEYGNRAKFNIAMRNLTTTVPDLIPIANEYKIENGGSLRKASVNPEFEKLAVQVKQNIRDLISVGNISNARSLLKEFEGISPDDPDIEVLKKEINNTLQ